MALATLGKNYLLNACLFSHCPYPPPIALEKNHLLRGGLGAVALSQQMPDSEENGYFLLLYLAPTLTNILSYEKNSLLAVVRNVIVFCQCGKSR